MTAPPQIQQRAAQPYVAIRSRVTLDGFPAAVDAGFPALFGWLAERGVAPAGPPFIRYLVIDGDAEFEIDVSVPVAAAPAGDGRVIAEALPAGRYATLLHVGRYDGLAACHKALRSWGREQGVAFDVRETERGEAWRGVVERYLVDPSDEPDVSKWETEVAFLLA